MKVILGTKDTISAEAAHLLPSNLRTRYATTKEKERVGMPTLESDLAVLKKYGAKGKVTAFRFNGWEVVKTPGHSGSLFTGGETFQVEI